MVSHIKVMACRHVQNVVQSVSKCPGGEGPLSPVVETSTDSPSTSRNSRHLRKSWQGDKRDEPSKPDGEVKHLTKNANTNYTSVQSCDFRCNDMDQQLSSKCGQPKKVSDDADIRNSPNDYLWQKLELLIDQMLSEEDGIPVRNVKSLMSTIPSTFTGSDIIHWLVEHLGASDVAEAVHLASRIASMGYIFCIDDHVLTVKNDGHTYYRFQTPFLYPSRYLEADTADYAVYLCKRTMQNKQRLELAGFEAERLASLQNIYCHKWEFIYIQAEAEAKVDKKRDKLERLVLESQERAYWDLHRPPPGCINTTDIDMRKLCRAKRPKKNPSRPVNFPIPSGPDGCPLFTVLEGLSLRDRIAKLQAYSRTRIKASKAAESLQNFSDQYSEFDLLLSTSTSGSNVVNVVGTNQGATNLSTNQLSSSANQPYATMSNTTSEKLTSQNRSTSTTGFNATSISLNVHVRTGSTGGSNINAVGSSVIVSGNGSHTSAFNPPPALGPLSASGSPNTSCDPAQESASALNPWISDNPDYWNTDVKPKFLPIRRIKRWSFSIHELLKDPAGLEEFQRWLEKEFSAENLRFWQACQELKGAPLKEVSQYIMNIYHQYLAPNAIEPLNVDSRIADSVRRQLDDLTNNNNYNRYIFEEAEEHIFHLMKSDSYCRFLRSDVYRELFRGDKKKSKKHRSTGSGIISSNVNNATCVSTMNSSNVNFTGID